MDDSHSRLAMIPADTFAILTPRRDDEKALGLMRQMTLGFTFGKGYKKPHNDRSGMDLCIGAAGQNIHNIAPVHGSIILHPRSGAIMLQGSSPQNPLVVIEGTGRIQLFADQSYVVSKQTRLQIGDLKFILRTCSYEGKEYDGFTTVRNDLFTTLGLEKPESHLESLPRPQTWLKLGSALIHSSLGGGSFGWVQVGVHYQKGEPLAVKTIRLGVRSFTKQILEGGGLSVVPSLSQAREILCYHGCSIDAANFRQQGHAHFCHHLTVTIWMVFPSATRDFAKHDWRMESLPVKAQMIRGILESLSALHKAGWMHRDLTPQNVLILPEKPPKAVVTDYGKALQAKIAYPANIGPLYTQAPEVDGTNEYTNRIDVWSAGLIICNMIIPEQFQHFVRLESPRNPNLGPQLINHLEIYGTKGMQEATIAGLVQLMISIDPSDRPEVADVLREFPKWDHERSEWIATSGHSDGPLTKKAKASGVPSSSDDGQWPELPAAGTFKDLDKEDEDLHAELGDLSGLKQMRCDCM
ncbi:MAG: hypothetical protein Q9194_007044 [Teloschistes cf. exilis]